MVHSRDKQHTSTLKHNIHWFILGTNNTRQPSNTTSTGSFSGQTTHVNPLTQHPLVHSSGQTTHVNPLTQHPLVHSRDKQNERQPSNTTSTGSLGTNNTRQPSNTTSTGSFLGQTTHVNPLTQHPLVHSRDKQHTSTLKHNIRWFILGTNNTRQPSNTTSDGSFSGQTTHVNPLTQHHLLVHSQGQTTHVNPPTQRPLVHS